MGTTRRGDGSTHADRGWQEVIDTWEREKCEPEVVDLNRRCY